MNVNIIVTTGQKTRTDYIVKAKSIAKELNATFVSRNNESIDALRDSGKQDIILVVNKQGLVAHTPNGALFFHLNMAQLRIKNLLAGKLDNMVQAMGLEAGMSVLDCTLGLATDAIIESYIVGDKGKVVGLEASPVTAFIVREGLAQYKTEDPSIQRALGRIEVIHADYNAYLRQLPDDSFDVVYIDPMFRRPIKESINLQPMRYVADHRAVELSVLHEAKRVAKKCVVMKETNCSSEFKRLQIETVVGGKYSSVNYGVIDANK